MHQLTRMSIWYMYQWKLAINNVLYFVRQLLVDNWKLHFLSKTKQKFMWSMHRKFCSRQRLMFLWLWFQLRFYRLLVKVQKRKNFYYRKFMSRSLLKLCLMSLWKQQTLL